jgi:hypothetical protein
MNNYRERPRCRTVIERFLQEHPDFPLEEIAYGKHYLYCLKGQTECGFPHIIFSDGLRTQAKKMLKEKEIRENPRKIPLLTRLEYWKDFKNKGDS